MGKHIDYSQYSDEKLIEIYRGGDSGACSYICEKFKPLVLKNAKPLFMAGAETEDLIQEGMIGLFSAIGDYDISSEVTFFHFANICIRNHMLKAVESSNRKKNAPLNSYISIYQNDEDSEGTEIFTAGKNPEEIIIEAENATNLVDDMMEVLSPMEKRVFDLYLQGLNYKEIAAQMGKSDKSIDNTLTRIKAKAKRIYE